MTDQTQQAEQPARRSLSEIAKEMYGPNFHGTVEEAKPVEATEEPPQPADTETGDEAPLELTPDEETPGEGETPEGGPEDTGEIPIATLSELAERFELDPEYVQTLKVGVHVDGTPTEATIGDLIKSYQVMEAAEHRLEAAKSIAQKESESWAAKHRELDGQYQVLAEMIKGAEAQLERDIKAVDPKLRDEDPAEWAARREEFNERRNAIAQMKVGTVESYKALQAKQAEEFKMVRDKFAAEQAQVLLQKLPEWNDSAVADAEKMRLVDYLGRTGFQQQELDNLLDHRLVLVARKAMLYDESRGQVDTAKKRVATVPKVMKPGAPKPAEQLASEKLAALKSKMAKTGTMEDALAYRMAKRGVR